MEMEELNWGRINLLLNASRNFQAEIDLCFHSALSTPTALVTTFSEMLFTKWRDILNPGISRRIQRGFSAESCEIAISLVTSPIVINVPNRELLVVETKSSFVYTRFQCYVHRAFGSYLSTCHLSTCYVNS